MIITNERLHHLGCYPEELGKYVLLPGDPKRVDIIAQELDNPKFVADKREYMSYTGELCGERVSVVSTGIGGPSAAIALEELCDAGVHTVIRVGTCGAHQPELVPGSLIIPNGAVRSEGTADSYMPKQFPAVPSYSVVKALENASKKLELPAVVGVVDSKDSYYGQHRPRSMPTRDILERNMQMWQEAGVLASEMECAAIFVVSAVRKIRCGAVLNLCRNLLREKATGLMETDFDTHNAIKTAVEALKILIKEDKDRL